MAQRNRFYVERDHRVVKWALIAAAFALSIGCVAETTLARRDVQATTVAGESVEKPSAKAVHVAG